MSNKIAETTARVILAVSLADSPERALLAAGVALAPPTVGALTSLFQRYTTRGKEAMLAAYDQRSADWMRQVVAQLALNLEEQRTRVRDLDGRVDEIENTLQELVANEEFQGVVDNYCVEATREATHERRCMLAHASAASFNVDLTIAEVSHAERVIRELNPEDIALLRAAHTYRNLAHGLADDASSEMAILVAAGCVHATAGASGFTNYAMTQRGALVERLLRSYAPSR